MRRTFLAGLLILLPLFVTYILVSFLIGLFTGVGEPLVTGLFRLLGMARYPWVQPLAPLVNLLLAIAVIFLLGLFGTNILGRQILAAFERLLMRLPLVKTIYSAAKQVVETFQSPAGSFQRVVMVQYPSKGIWAMGFVAAECRNALRLSNCDVLLTVFVPTTPNPTSGYLILLPPEEVVDVDYTVEEAFKFIVSSGILARELRAPVAPLTAASQQRTAADVGPKLPVRDRRG